jgi:ribosome maturation protein Sdo1
MELAAAFNTTDSDEIIRMILEEGEIMEMNAE